MPDVEITTLAVRPDLGSLRQWRAWTGLPFDTDGAVAVPKALVPVLVSQPRDRAVHVDVWVRRDLKSCGRHE